MAWGKNGSTTLSGSSDTLAITGMTANKFNQFMSHHIGGSGAINILYTFNNDSGSRYASRGNSGSEWTDINGTKLFAYYSSSSDYDTFNIYYGCFISGEEKLIISHFVDIGGSGAGNAPFRGEMVCKYVPASLTDTITSIDTYNSTSGDFTTGSNVSALGSDLTPAVEALFPTDVPDYSRFEETDTRKIYTKGTYGWTEIGTALESRGIFGGGTNVMDYINIGTTGNAIDFGDLTSSRDRIASVSSNTRGVWGGGGSNSNVMDYITISTTGNATDFGDLTVGRSYLGALSNNTRGVFGGGSDGSDSNVMDYITIATTGNATDFGNLSAAADASSGLASDTRGVFAIGEPSGSTSNVMDYITIATTGNATDFGNLTVARHALGGLSNNTRGVFGGYSNVMDYITIATTGNATDFGDLTVSRSYMGGVSNNTRGVFGGGSGSNVMDYITIATTGNATDFGDLTVARAVGGVDDS